ncbi:hypothetical protein [Winogradskyella schleiferi]|nr:hypothetical protein [Winogradskyella schleiferi]
MENEEPKYPKVKNLNEKPGVYYENGPPYISENNASSIYAAIV